MTCYNITDSVYAFMMSILIRYIVQRHDVDIVQDNQIILYATNNSEHKESAYSFRSKHFCAN